MNAQFASTTTKPHNNIIAAIGSTFPVAFHAFKKAFKDQTKVDWDKRISFALERLKREMRNRGHGTGSTAGTQRGVPVSENGAAKSGFNDDENFATAPFQYHPPAYGPRGTLPESEKEQVTEVGPQAGLGKAKDKSTQYEKIDLWMIGGNGVEPEPEPESVNASYHTENLEDTNDNFIADMDKILADINGQGNATVTTNTNNDEGFGDSNEFGGAFDYPFNTDALFMPSIPTDQNDPSQHVSFDNPAGMQDSFEPGSQAVGETQLAERAQGELVEFLEKPKLAFGSSILGKRKTSRVEDSQEAKKPAEVEDSFGGQSYLLDSAHGHGGDDMRWSFLEDTNGNDPQEANEAANEQLVIEMAD